MCLACQWPTPLRNRSHVAVSIYLRWLPIVFWPPANWFRNRAIVRALKNLRESQGRDKTQWNINKNGVQTLFQFQNIYRINTRRWWGLLELQLIFRSSSELLAGAKQRCLLPHVFAVFGVVCSGKCKREFYLQACVLIIFRKKDFR